MSIQGETHDLARPFFVMATQNPIESEGTYKLPEAQVDRFMFKLLISYPTREEESRIIERFTEGTEVSASRIMSTAELVDLQGFNQRVYVDEKIRGYVAGIVDATRHPADHGVDASAKIEFGASPRASIWLTLGAKSRALARGRGYVIPQDVKDVAHDVLRHRILLTYEAEAEAVTADQVVSSILDRVEVP